MSGSIYNGYAITTSGVVELVGKDETLAPTNYAGSVEIPLDANGSASGEILGVTLIQREEGSGSLLSVDGDLIILNADPSIAANAVTLGAAAAIWQSIVGAIPIANSDWRPTSTEDANGQYVHKIQAIPFESARSLWATFFLASATTMNDAGGDDEILECILRYRRDE